MKNNDLNRKMKELVSKQPSDQDMRQMKDEIWKSISPNLHTARKNQRMKRITAGFAIAAVILIGFIIYSSDTIPGEAVMQSLRSAFIEEKQEVIEIEGQKEEIDVHLETNEELSYIIYIDESRYKMVKGEDADRIEMLEPVEGFPEVYMEIRRVENMTTEEVVEAIKQEIEAAENMGLRREERTTEPIEAEMVQGMGLDGSGDPDSFGYEARTPIHRYYVTDTQEDQVFVIKQVYFLEAAEGHGARFHHMLGSFEITEQPEE